MKSFLYKKLKRHCILKITQTSLYRCTQLQYRFAVISKAPSICPRDSTPCTSNLVFIRETIIGRESFFTFIFVIFVHIHIWILLSMFVITLNQSHYLYISARKKIFVIKISVMQLYISIIYGYIQAKYLENKSNVYHFSPLSTCSPQFLSSFLI